MSDINDELRGAAAEIRGLQNIAGNVQPAITTAEKTFGETLDEAMELANDALGYCDYGFEDAWAAFAAHLRAAGLGGITLSLLDVAMRGRS